MWPTASSTAPSETRAVVARMGREAHRAQAMQTSGKGWIMEYREIKIALPMLKKIATRHGFAIDEDSIESTHLEMFKETKEWPKDLLQALKQMGYEFEVINSSEVCRVRVWQLAK